MGDLGEEQADDLELAGEELRSRVMRLRKYLRRSRDVQAAEIVGDAVLALRTGNQVQAALLAARAEAGVLARGQVLPPAVTPAVPLPDTVPMRRTVVRAGLTGGPGDVIPQGPVVVATDASGGDYSCGWAFAASTGQWGFQGRLQHHGAGTVVKGNYAVIVAELRAVLLALASVSGPVTVLTDSTRALDYLREWRAGNRRPMPPGYNLRPRHQEERPALVRLSWMVHERDGLTFRHVKGHSGHPLNEAADRLAGTAREWVTGQGRAEREVMLEQAARIAAPWLRRWRDSQDAQRING